MQQNITISISGCEGVPWEHVITDPTLPVDGGTEVTLSCTPGLILRGTSQATCNNGALEPSNGNTVSCAELGRYNYNDR